MDTKDIILMAEGKNPYKLGDEKRMAFREGFLTATANLKDLAQEVRLTGDAFETLRKEKERFPAI